ncbi:paraquat-inducible protein A [Burkholderia sp. Ac-20353]|uniref:paraquat-inducible protein A n=1 Tax=Burkholderia sp. Ac-20353 TaxID=2703894 RepID=UPI0032174731
MESSVQQSAARLRFVRRMPRAPCYRNLLARAGSDNGRASRLPASRHVTDQSHGASLLTPRKGRFGKIGAGSGPVDASSRCRATAFSMQRNDLIACHECDALLHKPRVGGRDSAHCPRCNALLYRSASAQLDRICALALAALITFVIAQAFPILEMDVNGNRVQTTLIGAIDSLRHQGMALVAVMVFCSTVLFPLIEMAALLYLLFPMRRGVIPPGFNLVLRAVQLVRPWGMIEVFMLGIVVTIVKMVTLARVVPEAALFAFAALTLMIAVVLMFDPGMLWDIADDLRAGRAPSRDRGAADLPEAPPPMTSPTADREGLASCHTCGLVQPLSDAHAHCARCGAALHFRTPNSLARTWALLIAAAILYIPANLLPIMRTSSIVGSQEDTIMSGVVLFWVSGDWPLAVVVFVASILVPMLKLGVLLLLVISAQRRSAWRPMQRTRLFRIVEHIGRWSMLDIFVVTLTVALVHFRSLAIITAGPGALAFGSVVILTMLASMQFDPRLIWDPVETTGKHHE